MWWTVAFAILASLAFSLAHAYSHRRNIKRTVTHGTLALIYGLLALYKRY